MRDGRVVSHDMMREQRSVLVSRVPG
jgi:hypothetical protein